MAAAIPIERIQDFAQHTLSLAPVIILGSGASAAHSIPGMWPLAAHLNSLPGIADPDAQEELEWLAFKGELDKGTDLETALGIVRLNERQTQYVVVETRSFLLPSDEEVLQRVIADNRHLPLARLFKYLFTSTQRLIDLVTPNYDRIAEYASDAAGFNHFCGFTSGYLQKRVETQTLRPSSAATAPRTVCIWKVHGSLDWFEGDNRIIGLRGMRETPAGHTPLMITPGTEKYRRAHMEPFRTILACSDAALASARAYLCVGYGFNDAHLQTKMVERCEVNSVPILVITKSISEMTKKFLHSGRCRKYLAIEECTGGSRAYSNDHPDGIELPGQDIWSLPAFLDFSGVDE